MTHALLTGSPAIDVGNPSILFNPAQFDQRGAPFVRVVDGNAVPGARIDMGAVERQPIPSAIFGDYNQNGEVDTADYVVWQGMKGSSITPYSGADGNGNGIIDQADYGVWVTHFGQTLPPPAAASGTATFLEHAEPITPAQAAIGEATFVSRRLAS